MDELARFTESVNERLDTLHKSTIMGPTNPPELKTAADGLKARVRGARSLGHAGAHRARTRLLRRWASRCSSGCCAARTLRVWPA
jgi:hypothetical protein